MQIENTSGPLCVVKKGGKIFNNFYSFNDFLRFYYDKLVTQDSVSWTDFVYNNYSEKSKREINGYTIEGTNELLQSEIDNFYKENGKKIEKKSDGFNIGCIVKNEDKDEYVKTPSTGVTGRYNWLNEIFIYKLLEKTGYGPKVSFDIPDFAPIVLIRAEDIKEKGDKYLKFSEKTHKSIGRDQNLSQLDLENIGAAEVLVGRILLLDDLHFKDGTNYSFFRDEKDHIKLKIFDLMSQHYLEDTLRPTYKEFGYSMEKDVFYTKRHPYYAVSGSFIDEEFRNLGIDLGIKHIERNKEKFEKAIKEAEKETYEVVRRIKQKFPGVDDQKTISELYNEKAFHEFRRMASDNLANVENFHSKSVAVKPSAALIGRNYQDKIEVDGEKDENDNRPMPVYYQGKNDSLKVKEQKSAFNLYLKRRKESRID